MESNPLAAIAEANAAVEAAEDAARRVVSHRVACHVIWHFGDTNLGIQPGKFVERLLLLLSAADTANRELLKSIYPEYVIAFTAVAQEPWGLDWLRKIAREVGS